MIGFDLSPLLLSITVLSLISLPKILTIALLGELLLASSSQDTYIRLWRIAKLSKDDPLLIQFSQRSNTSALSQKAHLFKLSDLDQIFAVTLESGIYPFNLRTSYTYGRKQYQNSAVGTRRVGVFGLLASFGKKRGWHIVPTAMFAVCVNGQGKLSRLYLKQQQQ